MYITSNTLKEKMIAWLSRNDDVLKWYKNGDSGRKHFSIPYEQDGKKRLFYPDFLIETTDNIYIVETKGVVGTKETQQKYKALKEYESQVILIQNELEGELLEKPVKVALVADFDGELYAYTSDYLDHDYQDIFKWDKMTY